MRITDNRRLKTLAELGPGDVVEDANGVKYLLLDDNGAIVAANLTESTLVTTPPAGLKVEPLDAELVVNGSVV